MNRDDWDARYGASALVWTAEPNRFLVEEAADLAPGRALDLACGEGRNALWLAERGWDVTAVDFSNVALDKARRLAAARGLTVTWVLDDVVTYGPTAEFDLVIVFYLQLPIDQRRAVWTASARAVAPGGTLLVVGHDSTNLAEGWGGPSDPAVLYGPDDVTAAISPLTVVRAERVRRPVETENGPRTAIDVLVRATRPLS